MKRSPSVQSSLPRDLVLKIASFLQLADVLSLGSCSWFWWELCRSDIVWESLSRKRWPATPQEQIRLDLQIESSGREKNTIEDWRLFYMRRHSEMTGKAGGISWFVDQRLIPEWLEGECYLKAVNALDPMLFEFEDIVTFFLKSKHNVVLNLIGLHYCIRWLGLPAGCIIELLSNCDISQRQVHVKWLKLRIWIDGVRLFDLHARTVSLIDIATGKEEEVVRILDGGVEDVRRVQISAAKPAEDLN